MGANAGLSSSTELPTASALTHTGGQATPGTQQFEKVIRPGNSVKWLEMPQKEGNIAKILGK
jgi:hypothetical protein